jgi:hypothetical protein
VARGEAAPVGLVVTEAEALGRGKLLDERDHGRACRGAAARTGDDVRALDPCVVVAVPPAARHRMGAEQDREAMTGAAGLEKLGDALVVGAVVALEPALVLRLRHGAEQGGAPFGRRAPDEAVRRRARRAAFDGQRIDIAFGPIQVADVAAHPRADERSARVRRVGIELVDVQVGVGTERACGSGERGERFWIEPEPGMGHLHHHGSRLDAGLAHEKRHGLTRHTTREGEASWRLDFCSPGPAARAILEPRVGVGPR